MERRTILTVVALALGGLGFLIWYNINKGEGDEKKAEDRPSIASTVAADVAIPVSAGDHASEFTAEISSMGGGALRSVKLQKKQYHQHDRTGEAPDYVPAEVLAAGPFEVVGTWDPGFYPFRLDMKELEWKGDAERTLTRLVRSETALERQDEGRRIQLKSSATDADLTIRAGDELVVGGKRFAIKKAVDEQTVELHEPAPDELAETGRIERVGTPLAQYRADSRFWAVAPHGDTVRLVWPNPQRDDSDVWIQRDWRVSGVYQLEHRTQFLNMATPALMVHYGLEVNGWVDPWEEEPGMFSGPKKFWSPACYVDGGLEEETLIDLLDEDGQTLKHPGSIDWFGVNSQYFLLAGVFPAGRAVNGTCTMQGNGNGVIRSVFEQNSAETLPGARHSCLPDWYPEGRMGSDLRCSDAMKQLGVDEDHLDEASLDLAMDRFAGDRKEAIKLRTMLLAYGSARDVGALELSVFAGPKDLSVLSNINPTLDSALDFWFVGMLAKPMLWLMKELHGYVGTWALAILLLTIIIKLLMLPLTQKSYTQMQKMQVLKPELEKIQKKYANNKQKLQAEMMNLYKRHNMNPLGGCLPMVVQMPVYIALYRCIYSAVDLYQAPLFGWITDMTQPDPYFVLPILLGGTFFVQQMFMPMSPGADPMQQKMIKYVMPVMFSVFMLWLPSGLVFYIFLSTVIGIGQQWYIKRKFVTPAGTTKRSRA